MRARPSTPRRLRFSCRSRRRGRGITLRFTLRRRSLLNTHNVGVSCWGVPWRVQGGHAERTTGVAVASSSGPGDISVIRVMGVIAAFADTDPSFVPTSSGLRMWSDRRAAPPGVGGKDAAASASDPRRSFATLATDWPLQTPRAVTSPPVGVAPGAGARLAAGGVGGRAAALPPLSALPLAPVAAC